MTETREEKLALLDQHDAIVDEPIITWWMSFAGPAFRGLIFTDGTDVRDALRRSWAMNVNPGGEVAGYELPYRVHATWRFVLNEKPVAARLADLEADDLQRVLEAERDAYLAEVLHA